MIETQETCNNSEIETVEIEPRDFKNWNEWSTLKSKEIDMNLRSERVIIYMRSQHRKKENFNFN